MQLVVARLSLTLLVLFGHQQAKIYHESPKFNCDFLFSVLSAIQNSIFSMTDDPMMVYPPTAAGDDRCLFCHRHTPHPPSQYARRLVVVVGCCAVFGCSLFGSSCLVLLLGLSGAQHQPESCEKRIKICCCGAIIASHDTTKTGQCQLPVVVVLW